jgi:hypothetical protein
MTLKNICFTALLLPLLDPIGQKNLGFAPIRT